MSINIKQILNRIGLDRAIAYSSGARVVQGVMGILTVFFISSFLDGVEQGFYYTFGSIVSLQVFFELGLTGIMTQYVAHEASHLQRGDNGEYKGDPKYESRLASLVNFCIKWYTVLAGAVLLFLLLFGYFYFKKYGDTQSNDVEWQLPWLLICLGTAIKLFQSPFNSILTGLGFVVDTSKITFYQQLVIPVITCFGLAVGWKLYVTGIGYLLSVLIWFFYSQKKGLLLIILKLAKVKITERISYIKEIFPFQWKIALSWVSGYFIFQLFNPVLFATEGAVVAGQMGMTLQALNAIMAFTMSWNNTKIPLYSRLIAQKDYPQLDNVFNKTVRQMSIVGLTLLVSFFLFIVILNVTQFQLRGSVLAERFLTYLPLFLMMIPIYLQQFTNCWATYLRCHKKEPFLIISVVCGFLCMFSTVFFGKLFGLMGIVIGYCTIQSLLFPWGYSIYVKYKKIWHK